MGTDIRVSGRPLLSKWRAKVLFQARQDWKKRRFLPRDTRIDAAINLQTTPSLAQFPDRLAAFPVRYSGWPFAAALPRSLQLSGKSDRGQCGKTLPPRQMTAFAATAARHSIRSPFISVTALPGWLEPVRLSP